MAAANSNGSAPGRPFKPGQSGNPAGRPKGVAKQARELINDDPARLLQVFLNIAEDVKLKPADRISAAGQYMDRAYGKAPAYAPVDGENPLELETIDRRIVAVLDELDAKRQAKVAGGGEAGPVADTG